MKPVFGGRKPECSEKMKHEENIQTPDRGQSANHYTIMHTGCWAIKSSKKRLTSAKIFFLLLCDPSSLLLCENPVLFHNLMFCELIT